MPGRSATHQPYGDEPAPARWIARGGAYATLYNAQFAAPAVSVS